MAVGPQCPARPRLCPARDPPFAAALALAAFRHVHRHVRLVAPSPALMLMAPCSGDVPLPRRRLLPAHALSMAPNGEEAEGGGTYVDLGSLPFDDPFDGIAIATPPLPSSEPSSTDTPAEETLEEWRAQHWIVLVDDEPSIRLAIGDYLHSAGYCTVTACDGPLAFLELLLHSCAWSLTGEGEANVGTELAAGIGGGSGEGLDAPPWITGADAKWRLPNCVISDIRMPGGIDGVQLLGLLRRVPGPPGDEQETEESRSKSKKRKKRGRPKKEDTASEYDAKDEYDLMDAIVSGGTSSATERIATPEDQAMKYLDAARECIDCLCQRSSADGPEMDLPLPYPASPEQIPVVLLTAKAMVADRIAGYRAGANGYLPKPFRPEELLGIVDGLMRKQERERSAWRSARQNKRGADATGEGALDLEFGDLTPEQAVDLTRDLVEVRKMLQAQVERRQTRKETAERDRLRSLLPNALWMLKTGERRPRAFSKNHIRAILLFCYGAWFPKNNTTRKGVMEELERRMADEPEKALGSQSS